MGMKQSAICSDVCSLLLISQLMAKIMARIFYRCGMLEIKQYEAHNCYLQIGSSQDSKKYTVKSRYFIYNTFNINSKSIFVVVTDAVAIDDASAVIISVYIGNLVMNIIQHVDLELQRLHLLEVFACMAAKIMS